MLSWSLAFSFCKAAKACASVLVSAVVADLATIRTTLRLSESGEAARLGGTDRLPGIRLDMKEPILDVSPSAALFFCLGDDEELELGLCEVRELLSVSGSEVEACLEILLGGSCSGDAACFEMLLAERRLGEELEVRFVLESKTGSLDISERSYS